MAPINRTETRDGFTLKFVSYEFDGHTFLSITHPLFPDKTLVGGRFVKTPRSIDKALEQAKVAHARNVARAEVKKAKSVAAGRVECQICAGSWAYEKGLTSMHGYTRPGCGWLIGGCMGAEQLPFHLSCKVLVQYLNVVKVYREDTARVLKLWQSGKKTSIVIQRPCEGYYNMGRRDPRRVMVDVTLTKREHGLEFQRAVDGRIANLSSDVRHADDEIKRVEERVAFWHKTYGEAK